MNRPVCIVALTDAGHRLADTLQKKIPDARLLFKPKPFAEQVQSAFMSGEALVLICATGIAVRTLAPVLNSKHDDPPVLVLDELGNFVIPLLSGHEGGANDWADNIASMLDAQCVMTTAKAYLKPIYTVGMGCERNCPEEELSALLQTCLKEVNLNINQIHSINSIELKADEQGLIALANTLEKPFNTYDKHELSTMESLLSVKSEYVYGVTGVYGVAESAALFSASIHAAPIHTTSKHTALENNDIDVEVQQPELVLNKKKTAKATCAIARCYRS